MTPFTRLMTGFTFILVTLTSPIFVQSTSAMDGEWQHGGTLFGELKYGPDFEAYEHVNRNAPIGGTLNQTVLGGYDSFNPFVVRGRAAAGLNYTGGLLWDTLFEQSVDQPSAAYGLVANAFKHPADFSSATYRIDPRAKFHDGEPIKPSDVIWSLEVLKENQPLFADYYRNVVRAEESGDGEVTFFFDESGNRELPHIMGDLPILPKHWWEGTGPDGNKRNIAEPTSEPPLGSGPYKISKFDLGKSIEWERVDDYWGLDVPVRQGRYNFENINYTYFLDDSALWEAFKKGGISDTRVENVSRRWATGYSFPAFDRGDVTKNAFPAESSEPFQGYYFNLRRDKFKDIRVRKALTLLFDFESMNKTLFFDAYTRTGSFFEGGELKASEGVPQGREREILEEYRGRIADEIIDGEFALPVYGSPADKRKIQRQALKLFRDAGFTFKDGKMLDPSGQQFVVEILGRGPTDERVGIPTAEYFSQLGIKVDLRIVDTAQYKNRADNFDFDMTMLVTAQSLSPGNEQREFWSSQAAERPGARNYSGISDPVIDEIVERIIKAPDRDELIALTQALDRILMAGYYAIPMWHNPDVWYSWWNKIQFPPSQPLYTGIDIYSLWIDEDLEAKK
ncbi:MAG: extracellular solute-binding protein [Pseudomonadota bacterium]